jgi:hypothetical protein
MFERPAKGDIDRALSTLMHEARRRLLEQRNEVTAEATKAGALQSTRLIIVVAEAAEKIHIEAIQQAAVMLRDFAQRMDVGPKQVTEWAQPHLANLGNSLLGVIPPCGFPNDHQRITNQYRAQFEQRLSGVLRDVEIGFVRGDGFAGMIDNDEWIRAPDAVALLKPILSAYSAKMRICERAHGGLIRSRAEQFHRGSRISHNCDVPKEFWYAEGHQALEQDWAVGDFSTWVERGSVQLKAFGVTFARSDIQKLLPAQSAVMKEAPATHTAEDEQRDEDGRDDRNIALRDNAAFPRFDVKIASRPMRYGPNKFDKMGEHGCSPPWNGSERLADATYVDALGPDPATIGVPLSSKSESPD